MKVHIEYGGQTLNCEMSDKPKNMKIALHFAWDMVEDPINQLLFMPKPPVPDKKTIKKALKEDE